MKIAINKRQKRERVEFVDDDETFEPNFQNDQHLVEEITTAIQKEDSISREAKEAIEIIADMGIVTLYGTVPAKHERMTIGDKAAAFAGMGHVKNNLQVKEGEE